MKNIGKRLRDLREDKKLSQIELANALGKSQVAISKYENSNRELDYDMLNKYAQFFHVSTDYLLGRTDSPNESYLSAEDYPDVLKPFIVGNKSSFIFSTNNVGNSSTTEEKKKALEELLKTTYASENQFSELLSLLPENERKKPITIHDLLMAIESNHNLMEKIKRSGDFDDRGELVLGGINDTKQQENKPNTKSDELASLASNCTPLSSLSMIPVVGNIAAGKPILARENIIGYIPTDIKNPDEYFYLHVEGDSMINAGIENDSDVLIRSQNCAENGQIVACFANGDSATLKRFKQIGDTVVLMPENSAYEPIIVKCSDFESGYARILGVAVRCVTTKEL